MFKVVKTSLCGLLEFVLQISLKFLEAPFLQSKWGCVFDVKEGGKMLA